MFQSSKKSDSTWRAEHFSPSSTGLMGMAWFLIVCSGSVLGPFQVASAAESSANKTKPVSKWDLYKEQARRVVQIAQWHSSKALMHGLRYAATKVVGDASDSDMEAIHVEFDELAKESAEMLQQSLSIQQSASSHWAVADRLTTTRPAVARMEVVLARGELKKLIQQNDEVDKRLHQLGMLLIQSEVIYQRILAESLLDDFKSIFGVDRLSMPQTPPDDWPEDSEVPLDPESPLFYDDHSI